MAPNGGNLSSPDKSQSTRKKSAQPREGENTENAVDKHMRTVCDEQYLKPVMGCVTTPREDARKLSAWCTVRDLSIDCECIVEMYELLWRWGNLDRFKNRNFFARFGFTIPESMVFVRGRPYAWYFMSKKDGSLLRKKADSLTLDKIQNRLCYERNIAVEGEICATWIPMSSQFSDERCGSLKALFLTPDMCKDFLRMQITSSHSQSVLGNYHISSFWLKKKLVAKYGLGFKYFLN